MRDGYGGRVSGGTANTQLHRGGEGRETLRARSMPFCPTAAMYNDGSALNFARGIALRLLGGAGRYLFIASCRLASCPIPVVTRFTPVLPRARHQQVLIVPQFIAPPPAMGHGPWAHMGRWMGR